MRYMSPSFTLPASTKTSNIKWDYTFMTDDEFVLTHGLRKEDFEELVKEPNGRSL